MKQVLSSSLLLLLVLTTSALAAQQPQQQSTTEAPKRPKFRLLGYLQGTTSVRSPDDAAYRASTSFDGLVYYNPHPKWALRAAFNITKALTGDQRWSLGNPEFRAFYSAAKLHPAFDLRIGPSLMAPLNADSLTKDSLIGGAGAFARIGFDGAGVGVPALGGYFETQGTTLFHRYQTSTLGDVNTQFQLEHAMVLSYDFTKRLNFTLSGGFSSAWSYEGGIRNSYSLRQEIDYTLTDIWQIGIGHSRGGDLFTANGRDLNVGIFSPNASRLYLSLNFQL